MKHLSLIALVSLSACSSLKESLQLGAGMGAVTGAAAIYSAQEASGRSASAQQVATGAAVGLGVGLLTSYLLDKSLSSELRPYSEKESPQMHFGDLPPSPFIMPLKSVKRSK